MKIDARTIGSQIICADPQNPISDQAGLRIWPRDPRHVVDGVVEWLGVSTNAAAQWGLAAIQNLALILAAPDAQPIPPGRV